MLARRGPVRRVDNAGKPPIAEDVCQRSFSHVPNSTSNGPLKYYNSVYCYTCNDRAGEVWLLQELTQQILDNDSTVSIMKSLYRGADQTIVNNGTYLSTACGTSLVPLSIRSISKNLEWTLSST